MKLTTEKKAEIIAAVAAHFRQQGVPARDPRSSACLYRSRATGRRCAIGALLTEDELRDEAVIKNRGIDELPDEILCRILGMPAVSDADRLFLREVQNAHDMPALDCAPRDEDSGRALEIVPGTEHAARWLEDALERLRYVAIENGVDPVAVGMP